MTRQSWAPSGECSLALQLCGAAWEAASVQLCEDHRERGPSATWVTTRCLRRSRLGKTEIRAVWCLSLAPAACAGPHPLLLRLMRHLSQECIASDLLLATTQRACFHHSLSLFPIALNGLVNLAGGLALQAIFLHCNQKGKSVVRRISSDNPCLLVLWAVSELEMKTPEKQARKEI